MRIRTSWFWACLFASLCLNVTAQTAAKLEYVNDVRVLQPVFPVISPMVKLAKLMDTVVAEVTVDKQGNAASMQFLQGSVASQLAHNDIRNAVQQWKFEPTSLPFVGLRTVTLKFQYKVIPNTAPDSLQGGTFLSPSEVELRYKLMPRAETLLTPEKYPHKDELGDGVCKVHQQPLRKDVVPIVYGLLSYDAKAEQSRARFFPQANTWVGGGCVTITKVIDYGDWQEEIAPDKYAQVEYCPVCRNVAARWHKAHPSRSVTKKRN